MVIEEWRERLLALSPLPFLTLAVLGTDIQHGASAVGTTRRARVMREVRLMALRARNQRQRGQLEVTSTVTLLGVARFLLRYGRHENPFDKHKARLCGADDNNRATPPRRRAPR
jgi:hypothetical protein